MEKVIATSLYASEGSYVRLSIDTASTVPYPVHLRVSGKPGPLLTRDEARDLAETILAELGD